MYIAGVDVSTKTVAVASLFEVDNQWTGFATELSLTGKSSDERLASLGHVLFRYFSPAPPTVAYIERIPFVRGQNGLSISRALGGVEAVLSILRTPYYLVNVSTWKAAIGNGRASKGEVRAWVDSNLAGALTPRPVSDLSENECDALGVAYYGVRYCQENDGPRSIDQAH